MNKKITLSEIADEAGVSITTVSRVINGSAHVNQHLKNKIEKIIKEKNYKRKKKKKIISIIVPDITNPFFSSVVDAMQTAANLYGYSVILFQCSDNKSIYEQCISRMKNIGVVGHIIIIPTCQDVNFIKDLLKISDVPVIFLDRKIDIENINYVGLNNEIGAYNATRYLLDLGHKSILYIAGVKDISTEIERFSGFTKAIQEENIVFDKKKFYIIGNHNFEDSYTQVKNILQNDKIKFSAIFSSSDIMCFGAKNAIEEIGLSIPNDISIIGYDNITLSSSIFLTTVSAPAQQMGKDAIISLLNIKNGLEKSNINVIIEPNMIIRKSCKKI